jgi:hypothetical protein
MELREKVAALVVKQSCDVPCRSADGPDCECGKVTDAVIALVMEEAAKVADREALRLRDAWHMDYSHGALCAATAIRDRARQSPNLSSSTVIGTNS